MNKISAFLIALFLFGCRNNENNYIRITCTETTPVPVSYAKIEVGITNIDTNFKRLDSLSHSKLLKILSIMNKYKIQEVNTNNSQLTADYENKKNSIFSQSYFVKMRDLEKIDALRNELAEIGCNEFKINSYSSDSLDVFEKLVVKKTLATARVKAEQIAENTGIKIGSVIKIVDSREPEENEEETYGRITEASLFGNGGFAGGVEKIFRNIEPTILKKTFDISSTYTVYYSIMK